MAEPRGSMSPASMPVDQVPVPDEVDALDARACRRRRRRTRTARAPGRRTRRRRRRSTPCRRGRAGSPSRPARVTSARSITTTSAPASLRQLGDRRAHAGGATDDERPLAVVPERVEQCPCRLSLLVSMSVGRGVVGRSGDDAADLEVHDARPSRGRGSSRISSPCSLNSGARSGAGGSPPYCTGAAASWNGMPSTVSQSCDVAVGDGLRVGGGLERVLHHRPLAGEAREPLAPLVGGALGERPAQQLGGLGGVGSPMAAASAKRSSVGELGPAETSHTSGQYFARLQAGERRRTARPWSCRCATSGLPGRGARRRRRPRHVELERQREGRAHRPQADAEQRHVDGRSPRRCARGGTARP